MIEEISAYRPLEVGGGEPKVSPTVGQGLNDRGSPPIGLTASPSAPWPQPRLLDLLAGSHIRRHYPPPRLSRRLILRRLSRDTFRIPGLSLILLDASHKSLLICGPPGLDSRRMSV